MVDAIAAQPPPDVDVDGLRMQQLKMKLRCTINAILDVRVHARGMTREEAMRLMTVRGHQEDSEAAGKWRRALLTSAQLSTYYVGQQEVSAIVRDLSAEQPRRLGPPGERHGARPTARRPRGCCACCWSSSPADSPRAPRARRAPAGRSIAPDRPRSPSGRSTSRLRACRCPVRAAPPVRLEGLPPTTPECERGQHRGRRRPRDPRLPRQPHRRGRGGPRRRHHLPRGRALGRLDRCLRGGRAPRRRRQAVRRQGRHQGGRRRAGGDPPAAARAWRPRSSGWSTR